MPSTIEVFSVELFYELFQYFNALELLHTFGNLNSNMNAIVSAAASHIKLTRADDYRIYHTSSILRKSNLSRIKSLHLEFDWNLEPKPMELLLEFFPLNAFSQLRSLTLITQYRLNSSLYKVLPMRIAHLTQLEYLHIDIGGSNEEYLTPIIKLIFDEKSAYGFGSLKQLVLATGFYNPYFILSSSIQKKTKIEHLAVNYVAFSEFIQLVPCLPCVKSVKIRSLRSENNDPLPTGLCLPNCTSFLVKNSSAINMDRLRVLLRCLPNLKNLRFSADRDDYRPTDFEEILQQECPKLTKLKLRVYFSSKYIRNMDEYEHVFKTSFWWTQRRAEVNGSEIEYGVDGCLDEVTVEFDLTVS